jgi:TRAP transporter TAXI family solute receptor
MRYRRHLLPIVSMLVVAAPAPAQDLRLFSIGSGELDGGYFATARAICEAVNRAERKRFRCSPESTPGSLYNLVALDNGQLDFAIVQSDWHKHAFKGTSVFETRGPMTWLRSVMSLYPEPFTLVARPEAGIRGIRDLVGKRVDVGHPASGRQGTVRAVMERFRIKLSDFSFVAELPGSDAIDELCRGRIDATMLIIGHPSKAIGRAMNECAAELVSLGGPEIDELVAHSDDYHRASIPLRSYARPDGDVATFAVWATAVTLASMKDDVVEALVRLRVYEGTGKALVCWTPYWNQHMYQRMTGETIEGSLFE